MANEDGIIQETEFLDDPTGNERNIRVVRISILARTLLPDPHFLDPNASYTVADHTLTLGESDRRYHRFQLTETVLVRNMNL